MFDYSFTDRTPTLTKKMEDLGKKSFAERAADVMLEIIDIEFRTSRTIWGDWEGLKLRDGKPLFDSGELKDSWKKREISPGEWEVFCDSPIGIFMEFGVSMYMTPKQRRKFFGFILPKDKYNPDNLLDSSMIIVPERPMGRPAYEETSLRMKSFLKDEFKI